MNFDSLYANPMGRTSRTQFTGALIPLLAAAAFYHFLAHVGLNGEWVLVTLFYPGVVLHARRLHDMGQSAFLLLIPGAIDAVAIALHWTHRQPDLQPSIALAGLVVTVGVMIWCLVGKGQAEANKFGEPLAA
jgi:uncharacterized membrane protein YhaH (DUF805 family)